MLYLVATILLNVYIFVLFKLFPKYHVDSLQAVVFNYIICVVTGSLFLGDFPVSTASVQQPWFLWAIINGVFLITLFNLMAYCTKADGITATTIANKLSLVIPVTFSIILYNEPVSFGKIAGILLAAPAIYLATKAAKDETKVRSLLLPIVLFIGSGLFDTTTKYIQHHFLDTPAITAVFTIHSFAIASVLGLVVMLTRSAAQKTSVNARSIAAGILLGIPNYFSVYYFIRLLNSDFLNSSAAIPVNNIGIVVVSSLAAMLFLKERPVPKRIIGLVLSVISILLIALSDRHGNNL